MADVAMVIGADGVIVPNTTTDRGTISFRRIKNLIVLASLWYFGAAKRVHRDLSFCCLAVPPAKVYCFA